MRGATGGTGGTGVDAASVGATGFEGARSGTAGGAAVRPAARGRRRQAASADARRQDQGTVGWARAWRRKKSKERRGQGATVEVMLGQFDAESGRRGHRAAAGHGLRGPAMYSCTIDSPMPVPLTASAGCRSPR